MKRKKVCVLILLELKSVLSLCMCVHAMCTHEGLWDEWRSEGNLQESVLQIKCLVEMPLSNELSGCSFFNLVRYSGGKGQDSYS